MTKSSEKQQPVLTRTSPEPWKIKTFVLGGVIGAAAGLLSAYLLVRNSERNQTVPTLSSSEAFRIAVFLLGTIRNIANLWE